MYTYWVEYEFIGEQWNDNTRSWDLIEDCAGCRFTCLKKDIKKKVQNKILDDWGDLKFLKLNIYDFYRTTDCEV
jgi:hypothetical protein